MTWHPFIAQAKAEGAKTIAGGPPDEFGHSFEIASSEAVADPKRAAALKDYVARLRKAFAWGGGEPGQVGGRVVEGVQAAAGDHQGRRAGAAGGHPPRSPTPWSSTSRHSPTG